MVDNETFSKILIAKWTDRFLAWFIDFIIVSIISTSIIVTSFGTLDYGFGDNGFWAESMHYIPTSILFFVYWIILEYKTGQTIGKKFLNLKVTDIYGNKPGLKGIIISSFGKSFLLPIDVILGLFLTNKNRQRIFNKLGNTLIVKIKDTEEDVSDIKYMKD